MHRSNSERFDFISALDQYFFRSSTIFFLFISGFLCQYLFTSRPQPPITYYKKKLQNVICPFLFFSIGIGLLRGDSPFSLGFWRDVALGRIQLQYWYIPFVSILFLVSPLLCRLTNRLLLSVAAISLVIFCTFPVRPEVGFALSWSHTFHLYAYFTVFYLLGFVYCRYKAQMFAAIKKHIAIIALIAVAASVVMPYAKSHIDAHLEDRGISRRQHLSGARPPCRPRRARSGHAPDRCWRRDTPQSPK